MPTSWSSMDKFLTRLVRHWQWQHWVTQSLSYNTMQCNAMQCNAMQCNAMQCNAMQYNTIQYKFYFQMIIVKVHDTWQLKYIHNGHWVTDTESLTHSLCLSDCQDSVCDRTSTNIVIDSDSREVKPKIVFCFRMLKPVSLVRYWQAIKNAFWIFEKCFV